MGPGILIKALLRGSFSLMVFGWAQIVMDIQPLIVLVTKNGQLHGFSHTYAGATLLAIFSALSGKYLCEIGLKVFGLLKNGSTVTIAWWIAFTSSFVGTFSHVVLDSIMHSDVAPYYPLSTANNLFGLITPAALYQFCLFCGFAGAILYYSILIYSKKTGRPARPRI